MELFETPAFTRFVHDYLSDEEYRALQRILAQSPEMGDVMPGTGGFRKAKVAEVAFELSTTIFHPSTRFG